MAKQQDDDNYVMQNAENDEAAPVDMNADMDPVSQGNTPTPKDYVSRPVNPEDLGDFLQGLQPKATTPTHSASADDFNKLAADRSSIDSARKQAEDNKSGISMTQGFARMFGAHPGDDAFYNNLRGDQDKQVAQIQGDKQQQLSNYLAANKLTDDDLGRQKTMGDMDEQERQRKVAAEQDDPTSDSSKALRGFIKQVAGPLAAAPGFAGASYSQLAKGYAPYVQAYEASEAKKLGYANLAAYRESLQGINANKITTAQNEKFGHDYNTERNKYLDQVSKIKDATDAIDQAVKEGGGVAASVVPAALAKSIVQRVTQGEINQFSGDPSVVARIKALYQSATEGTMTYENAQEFRNLLGSQLNNATNTWQSKSDAAIKTHAGFTRQNEDDLRKVLGAPATGSAAPPPASAPQTTPAGTPPTAAKQIKMTRPDGKAFMVPADKVEAAKAQKWTVSDGQ